MVYRVSLIKYSLKMDRSTENQKQTWFSTDTFEFILYIYIYKINAIVATEIS